ERIEAHLGPVLGEPRVVEGTSHREGRLPVDRRARWERRRCRRGRRRLERGRGVVGRGGRGGVVGRGRRGGVVGRRRCDVGGRRGVGRGRRGFGGRRRGCSARRRVRHVGHHDELGGVGTRLAAREARLGRARG